RDDRLPEPARRPPAPRRRAAPERRPARRGTLPTSHLPLVPGLHVKELDAEPLVIVHVDNRPRSQVKRRPVALHSGLRASAACLIELRAVAKAERDVEEPQVADPVALGPGAPGGIRVRD